MRCNFLHSKCERCCLANGVTHAAVMGAPLRAFGDAAALFVCCEQADPTLMGGKVLKYEICENNLSKRISLVVERDEKVEDDAVEEIFSFYFSFMITMSVEKC